MLFARRAPENDSDVHRLMAGTLSHRRRSVESKEKIQRQRIVLRRRPEQNFCSSGLEPRIEH